LGTFSVFLFGCGSGEFFGLGFLGFCLWVLSWATYTLRRKEAFALKSQSMATLFVVEIEHAPFSFSYQKVHKLRGLLGFFL
jgi:hypothetical protein